MDWLAASLTAVTVVLAAAAILLGIVGIFGYGQIKQAAIESVEKIVRKEMKKYLKESNVRDMLKEHVREEGDGLYAEMAQSPEHDIEDNQEKRAS